MNAARWRAVAPWYRWDLQDHPDPERAKLAGRPALHKFGNEDFIDDFQADAQSAQPFTEEDFYYRIDALDALPPIVGGPNGGKVRRLITRTRVKTDTRKLFLPVHSRYYLVAFELHCDRPGFPVVQPDAVAEAGFVIRRRVTPIAPDQVKAGNSHLSRLAVARATVAQAQRSAASSQLAEARASIEVARDRTRRLVPIGSRARRQVAHPGQALVAARREVVLAQRKLALWSAQSQLETTVQGWVRSPNGVIGTWQPMPDAPEVIVEETYPMFRLVPNPADPDSAARSGTIFYGYVPTCGAELAPDGSPRFGDADLYEIRCYARPVDDGDCPSTPVWSEPTDPFRLASFYDPAGLAQRPINVRMPDFADLEASAALPSVRVSTPPGSGLVFATDKVPPTTGSVTGAAEQICFFAIPLITIVAMFLLNLFLPIIMLLFGLWWMLKLKLCIPPSLEVGAQVSAELAVIPGGIQVAASLEIDVDLTPGVDQQKLRDALVDGFNTIDPSRTLGTTLGATYSNGAMVTALAGQGFARPNNATPAYPTTVPTSPRVTRDQVVHP
ncbi:hypothetical protein AB0L70_35830 [Kribbella sp. NPDC051952]|uniref:hypothetical protein n=1 Tax=Kribbella sp. NPDC051952 TaxID=3154851 RepID=UPI00343F93C8